MKKGKNNMDTNDILTRGVERIFPTTEAFGNAISTRRIKIYLGIDPTGPTLHLGHGIALKKLRDLQRLGHTIILLIGDFTAQIGDPTDKAATRKKLTHAEVMKNCQRYKQQAARFLDFESKTNPVQLVFNNEWLGKLSLTELLPLLAEFTTRQFMERDMFKKRIADGKPVYLHELVYPLLQGFDSVTLDVDAEIGGNDQTFNMLVGRDMMKRRGKEKFVIAMKLLEDPTGAKMGKTTGNMITFDDTPEDMFGKVMNWTDGMMAVGFELCTDVPMDEVRTLLKQTKNPRDAKMRLAREVVTLYHGADAAAKAEAAFVKMFQKRETPEEIPECRIQNAEVGIIDVLVKAKLAKSKGDARRLVEQGGVKVDGKVVKDPTHVLQLSSVGALVQKGKRHFVRVY